MLLAPFFQKYQMADAGVAAATDFDWASQMRFYWRGDDETGHLKVRIALAYTTLYGQTK